LINLSLQLCFIVSSSLTYGLFFATIQLSIGVPLAHIKQTTDHASKYINAWH